MLATLRITYDRAQAPFEQDMTVRLWLHVAWPHRLLLLERYISFVCDFFSLFFIVQFMDAEMTMMTKMMITL